MQVHAESRRPADRLLRPTHHDHRPSPIPPASLAGFFGLTRTLRSPSPARRLASSPRLIGSRADSVAPRRRASWPGRLARGTNESMAARQKKSAPPTAGAGPSVGSTAGPADQRAAPVTTSAATRQSEIETKLEIDPATKLPSLSKRRRLAAVGIVGAADPMALHLDATYYDTACLDLLRSRMTLRRRTGGPDAGWHLKLPAAQGARTEVQLPLAAGSWARCPPSWPGWCAVPHAAGS